MNRVTSTIIVTILILLSCFAFFRQAERNKKFDQEKKSTVIGVFQWRSKMAKACSKSSFYYEINNEKYELIVCGTFPHLTEGDSILEYLIQDPNISRVKNSKIMTKFK